LGYWYCSRVAVRATQEKLPTILSPSAKKDRMPKSSCPFSISSRQPNTGRYACKPTISPKARCSGRLIKPTNKDSFAVITDLDETALDNSADEAQLILDSTTYTQKSFDEWARAEKAKAVPGSVAFFNFVNGLNARLHKKIDIYYVSNRDSALTQVTMENMAQLGYPQLTRSHFLFQTDRHHPSKEGRRQQIEKNHTVILLLGDNLIDLDSTFDSHHHLTEGERRHRVDSLADYFGDKYIVFPNAIYGDWEGALYNYHYPPLDTVMQIRKDSLHGYR
jgi:5'-nucleotidase (lipoprotein e(P4) family)